MSKFSEARKLAVIKDLENSKDSMDRAIFLIERSDKFLQLQTEKIIAQQLEIERLEEKVKDLEVEVSEMRIATGYRI